MSKVALTFILFVSVLTAQAQIKYGVEAGYLNNNLSGTSLKNKSTNNYMLGGIISYTTNSNWVIESGLSYEKKGISVSDLNIDLSPATINKIDADMNYIQLPLVIGHNIKLSDKISITPKVGGYIASGIDGDGFVSGSYIPDGGISEPLQLGVGWKNVFQSSNFTVPTLTEISKVELSSFNRFDAGVRVGMDVNFSKFALRAAYNWGLKPIGNNFVNDAKNRTFTLSLAYYIN